MEQELQNPRKSSTPRRRPGRPRILRTSRREKPRKIFNVVNHENDDEDDIFNKHAGIAEIPLKDSFAEQMLSNGRM